MRGLMRVCCRVQGLGAEKLLNEARIKGLTLSQVRREADRALSVVCAWRDYAPFAAMAQARGFCGCCVFLPGGGACGRAVCFAQDC